MQTVAFSSIFFTPWSPVKVKSLPPAPCGQRSQGSRRGGSGEALPWASE